MKKKQRKKIEKELNRMWACCANDCFKSSARGLVDDFRSQTQGIEFTLHVLGYQALFINDKYKIYKIKE